MCARRKRILVCAVMWHVNTTIYHIGSAAGAREEHTQECEQYAAHVWRVSELTTVDCPVPSQSVPEVYSYVYPSAHVNCVRSTIELFCNRRLRGRHISSGVVWVF